MLARYLNVSSLSECYRKLKSYLTFIGLKLAGESKHGPSSDAEGLSGVLHHRRRSQGELSHSVYTLWCLLGPSAQLPLHINNSTDRCETHQRPVLRRGFNILQSPNRVKRYCNSGYQLNLLNPVLCFVLCARSHKRGRLTSLFYFRSKMDRSRATYFTQDEQILIMQGYEEFKETITAKSNTVAANRAREGCWQKSADV